MQAGTSYGQGGGGYTTPTQNRGYGAGGGGYGGGNTAGAYAAPVQANTYGAANTYGGMPPIKSLCCLHDMVGHVCGHHELLLFWQAILVLKEQDVSCFCKLSPTAQGVPFHAAMHQSNVQLQWLLQLGTSLLNVSYFRLQCIR